MWRHGLFQWNPFARRVACHGPGFDAELIVVKDGALNMPLSLVPCHGLFHHPSPSGTSLRQVIYGTGVSCTAFISSP